jgi:FKBP-type peptidyl-prolyl cis-trans isomerase SlyD
MKITQDTVVTMHYKVVNAQGQVLDKAQEPTSYLHGGYDNTLPKIEKRWRARMLALPSP